MNHYESEKMNHYESEKMNHYESEKMNHYECTGVTEMRFHATFKVAGKYLHLQAMTGPMPDTETVGIPSTTQDMHHVLFLDYDGVDPAVVRQDYFHLANLFRLGTGFVFVSDRKRYNWHVINPERFLFSELIEILKHSHADEAFKTSLTRSRFRNLVLRVTPKGKKPMPQYHDAIKTPHHTRTVSLAHTRFLRDYYGVPAERLRWQPNDDLTELRPEIYMTREVTT